MTGVFKWIKTNPEINQIIIEIEIQIKFFFYTIFTVFILLLIHIIFLSKNIFNFKNSNALLISFKNICLLGVTVTSCIFFFSQLYVYIHWFNNDIINLISNSETVIKPVKEQIVFSLINNKPFVADLTSICITKTAMIFNLLFCLLYPIIFYLLSYDYNEKFYKFYIIMYLIFILSFILIFTNNIIIFYFTYESILVLVFSAMYLSSNSRGGIEAALFFLG
jgi:hypothetical protein